MTLHCPLTYQEAFDNVPFTPRTGAGGGKEVGFSFFFYETGSHSAETGLELLIFLLLPLPM